MYTETLIGGFGGQGILFMGRILATAGMFEGFEVSWYPSYGPEMRGGTATCTVIVSSETIGATQSEHPDVCIAMNEPSLRRYAPGVREKGLLAVNSSLVHHAVSYPDINVLMVPANELVARLPDPRTLNMVMLGAVLAYHPVVHFETLQAAIRDVLAGKPDDLVNMNLRAIEAGKEFIIQEKNRGGAQC
ncbi:MAG TPA: 2-oxoacid:acceptor oxidoreductase family protein [Atribacteraceae bacterium]|nr:2-oxoacid:acceptor oxidoreductase family protein [Atribacteraceae bacterium]